MKDKPLPRIMPDLGSAAGDVNLAKLSPKNGYPNPSDSDPLRALIATIKCGLAKRQFHITNGEGLQPLWVDGIVSFREKLCHLHRFAEAHVWAVTSKDRFALVLFQPVGGTMLLSGGSWLGRDR